MPDTHSISKAIGKVQHVVASVIGVGTDSKSGGDNPTAPETPDSPKTPENPEAPEHPTYRPRGPINHTVKGNKPKPSGK